MGDGRYVLPFQIILQALSSHNSATVNSVGVNTKKTTGKTGIRRDTVLLMLAWKFKITASRLAYLLGLLGKSKFNLFWNTIKNGTAAPDISYLNNIKRGQMFENDAIKNVEMLSNAKIEKVVIFVTP